MTPHRKPRQVDRVLAALRAHPNGIHETLFQPPYVYDGQKPIRRVAARVLELRAEGYDITTAREANGLARYTLIEADEGDQTRLPVQEAA